MARRSSEPIYNLDAAEVNLLRLAPLDYLESNLPNLIAAAAEVRSG